MEIESTVRKFLIDDTWFYANKWGLPELFFEKLDIFSDPTWHEFDSVVPTSKKSTAGDISTFLATIITRTSI